MTAVKICGVCRPADAAHASAAGAAYIGVILAPDRSRTQTLASAAAIFEEAASRRVGVFVDASPADVLHATDRLRLDVVQLHGGEAPDVVDAIRAAGAAEVWKAVRVRSAADVEAAADAYTAADGLLLDGWSAAGHGGVGARFDWAAVAPVRRTLRGRLRVIAAGGLSPDNVAGMVELLRPHVADVSSGVEEAVGRKSADRVSEFIAAVRGVEVL